MTTSLTSSVLSKTISFVAVSAAALLLTACNTSDSSLQTWTSEADISNAIANAAITEAIDISIIPAVNKFQQQTTSLVEKSETFCSNLSEENLTTVQAQWINTNAAWFELLPYRFGPMLNSQIFPIYTFIDSHRLRGDNYSVSVRNKIDSLLASADSLEASTFADLEFQFVGLLALEISLFEDAAQQSPDKAIILAEYQSNPRKCALLNGYANQLLQRSNSIQQGWLTNYRNTNKSYRELLINGQLEAILADEAGDSAIKKVTVSVQEFYDYIGKRNVTTNVAQLSGSVWPALASSLQGTIELLQGTAATQKSLNDIMVDNRFDQTIINVQSSIDWMTTAIADQNNTDVQAAAKAIDGNFKRDIPEALNINLGLNFSDGD